jgi:hypothetical protein
MHWASLEGSLVMPRWKDPGSRIQLAKCESFSHSPMNYRGKCFERIYMEFGKVRNCERSGTQSPTTKQGSRDRLINYSFPDFQCRVMNERAADVGPPKNKRKRAAGVHAPDMSLVRPVRPTKPVLRVNFDIYSRQQSLHHGFVPVSSSIQQWCPTKPVPRVNLNICSRKKNLHHSFVPISSSIREWCPTTPVP